MTATTAATALTLWNTLSRSKETLPPPAEAGTIKLYTCGPTVYNLVHIGNLRAFLVYDLLRRTLAWLGYDVKHVMNLTDVDDKTIRGSRAEGLGLREFTERYTELFLADMDALSILRPDVLPRATDAIEPMVALVEDLISKGNAYKSDDGSVYFKISAFEGYGKLSRLDARELQAGAGGRVAADEYDKDSVQDFALWKSWSEDDGDVFWETSLGKGRPGWHLECSVLAMEHLGSSIDIHAGGVDLVFPHHENEIAQSEASSGQPFSRYWVHNEHLLVGGKKMSKSLGNFYTLTDLAQQARASGREVRYALLAAHHRKQLNFVVEYDADGKPTEFTGIETARKALIRIDAFRERLGNPPGGEAPAGARALLQTTRDEIRAAFADDLNLVAALGKLFELVSEVNRLEAFDAAFAQEVLAFLDDVDQVFGFLQPEAEGLGAEEQDLFDRWVAARESKDWGSADGLRDQLKDRGIQVQARKGEASWTKL